MAPPVLVSTPEGLAHAVARLSRADRVALDTEGNSMHAYRTRLCLIQLADAPADRTAEEIYLVDPLAPLDLAPLAPLLGPAGPPKIVHDVGYDARLLHAAGLPLGRVIDTALHARMLGLRETGLASLLGARFGVVVSKALQQHDWALRPLDARTIAYLANDVATLGQLAAQLEAEAAALDIAAEIAEETAYGLDQARLADNSARGDVPRPYQRVYQRVPGVRALPAVGRAVLRELAAVREAAAERWDLPPGRVVANAGLLALARARPHTVPEVLRVTHLPERHRSVAAELVAAVARGELAGDVPDDERAWFAAEAGPGGAPDHARERPRRARETALSAWRAAEATRRGVDRQVVLPGHVLGDLAARGAGGVADLAAVPGFGAARVERYGAELLALLAGAVAPRP